MKSYMNTVGPFRERPFYTQSDIENMCLDELSRAELLPSKPAPIRIERFIEKRFKVSPSYEDLPDGVLGLTKFTDKGVREIVVSRALEEEGSEVAERRIRTTLGHETGHGLLHSHLFVLALNEQPMFGDFSDPKKPKVLLSGVVDGTMMLEVNLHKFLSGQHPNSIQYRSLITLILQWSVEK